MKRINFIIIAAALLFNTNYAQQDDSLYIGLKRFSNVINHIKTNYVEDANSLELINAALSGMLHSLDPHTSYLRPLDSKKLRSIEKGDLGSLGLEFDIVDEVPIIISIAPYSPAYSSRIKPGDMLISVDYTLVKGLSYQELILLLYGEEGEEVELKFKSGITEKEYIVILEYDDFKTLSVPFVFNLNYDNIGYIKCTSFEKETPDAIEDALDNFYMQRINNIIIDLRGNPGGLVSSCAAMADLFLPEGRNILFMEGRKKEMLDTLKAEDDEYLDSSPKIIILVDRGSASGSEAFSGALQDNDRAVVIGTNTFGKGLVMRNFYLDNGGAVYMTVGRYKTPAGRVVQRDYKGIRLINFRNDIYKTDSVNIKTRPTFKSLGGRTLYCGGGIVPDIFVESDDRILHDLSVDENQFYKYASKVIADKALLDKKVNPEDIKNTEIPAVYMEEALASIKGKDDSQIPLLTRVITNKIKRNMAGILLGEERAFRFSLDYDNQLQTAINAFPNVNSILFPNKGSQE